jgi:hypothetical protein
MITGFNTDVDYMGRVFHVQTEDKGIDNPTVESLVYCGGEIVECRRNSYADLLAGGASSDGEIHTRMEAQHQALIRDIRNGRFDPDSNKPFGHNIISNRSLDEVVVDFLLEHEAIGALRMELVGAPVLRAGASVTVKLHVIEERTRRPVSGADVKLTLISTQDKPQELFAGVTDASGEVEAPIRLPQSTAELAVLLRASASGRRAVLRERVHAGGAKAGSRLGRTGAGH